MFYRVFPQEPGRNFVEVLTYDRNTVISHSCDAGYLAQACGAYWHRSSGMFRMSPRRFRIFDRLAREGWVSYQRGYLGLVYHPSLEIERAVSDFDFADRRCKRTLDLFN